MTFKTITKEQLRDLFPFTIGFEDTVKRLDDLANYTLKAVGYPPYNIVKVDDNKYVVELAVAGFSKTNIEITLEENKLIVSGKTNDDAENLEKYLHKGIADRSFSRTFALADTVEVKNAELLNGMLRIWLENIIPDYKKPRKVEIKDSNELVGEKQVLKG